MYFNFLIFNFAPLQVLRLGRVPHVPQPCYGPDESVWVQRSASNKMMETTV
jgi:hypothetical protein